jgi:hypothetical protein
MKNKPENNLDFIDPMEFSVENNDVVVGETYPIYGKINDIVKLSDGKIILLVNDNVELTLDINKETILDELIAQAFEPGIFISTIDSLDYNVKATCSSIVFDKKKLPTIN